MYLIVICFVGIQLGDFASGRYSKVHSAEPTLPKGSILPIEPPIPILRAILSVKGRLAAWSICTARRSVMSLPTPRGGISYEDFISRCGGFAGVYEHRL